MDSKFIYSLMKQTAKLEKLIENNAPYEKILKQSKIVDKYIFIKMQYINDKKD